MNPVERLVWSKRLANAIIVAVVGASLLVTLSVALLNWVVVPRVSDWRSDIERISSEYLGSEVRIDQIEVDTSRIIPSFQIVGLNIQSVNERAEAENLSLPIIKLDLSLRSILSLSFDQIVLDNPVFSVVKNQQGQIRVAGLSSSSKASGKGLDWFFSQPNVQVRHATALWLDEGLSKEATQFSDLEVYFINGLKSHDFRLEATPPKEIGERFSLQANFKESLLSTHAGDFNDWSGTSLVNFPHIDISLIDDYLPKHSTWEIQEGSGWLRIWSQVHKGKIAQITTDVNFPNLSGYFSARDVKNQKIQLKELNGRFQLSLKELMSEFKTQDLSFVSNDGNRWSVGRVSLSWTPLPGLTKGAPGASNGELLIPMQSPGSGIIEADKVSIKPIISQLTALPIDVDFVRNLKNIELAGDLSSFKMAWDFDGQKASAYSLQGQLRDFTFERLQNADENFLRGLPGLHNAAIQFDFNSQGGNASLAVDNGSITLANWLEEPVVPLVHASADVHWASDANLFNLKINKTNIVTADAKGDFELNWSIPKRAQTNGTGNNSIIDLIVTVQQGDASRVYRYLPMKIDARVRQYLQKSITKGAIKNSTLKIKGPLNKFPFVDPSEGEFHISSQVADLTYQYAPTQGSDAKSLSSNKAWPELAHLNGELILDRKSLFIKKGATKLSSPLAPGLEWFDVSAEIQDLSKPTVNIKARGKGPLGEMIKVINNSAIGDLLDNSLVKAESSGPSDSEYALNLSLPLNDLVHAKVNGSLGFSNNDLTFVPGLPNLNRVRGSLSFDESGFTLSGVKARILGSDARVEGGLKFTSDKFESTAIKIQGAVTAEGLRQAKEMTVMAKVGRYLSGQTNYLASLTFKQGQLDFELNSTLQGLSSQLPVPLAKKAETVWPLKISAILSAQSPASTKGSVNLTPPLPLRTLKTTLTLGQIGLANLVTDFTPLTVKPASLSVTSATQSRGWFGINTSSSISAPNNLDPGYVVSLEVPKLDADAWERVLSDVGASSDTSKSGRKDGAPPTGSLVSAPTTPTVLRVKTPELIFSGRSIHQVAMDAVFLDLQPSGQWHVNINSTEARGAIDYKLANSSSPPKVFARMSLLVIPPSALDTVESLLNNKETVMPALDIIVDELELKGKKLGRAEIEALNQPLADGGKEWRISKLNLIVPEGKFQATGVWSFVKDGNKNQNLKKTVLDFYLDIDNAGLLLDRLGTKGAVSGGKGRLNGQISWLGSPIQMDYPSLGGHFNVNVEKGSFLKTEPGAGRLLGVLNLQALPRRLLLDFKDIFSDGFAFDFFRGDVSVESGIAKTNNLQMKGVNAAIFMEGRADISNETQNLKVIVIPEIDAGTASLVVAAINPVIGISTYLAQYFLKKPIAQATTKDFLVEGTWSDPKVTKIDGKVDIKNDSKSNLRP